MTTTYLRQASLPDIAGTLEDFRNRSCDYVRGAAKIRALSGHNGGTLELEATGTPTLTEDGVDTGAGEFLVNEIANEGLATKLQIPTAYAQRMLTEHPDLWAANVNGWLARSEKAYLIRTYTGHGGLDPVSGTARAFLSDSYKPIDNYDVVLAALAGVGQIMDPHDVHIDGDLTERRLYLRMTCPKIAAAAEALLHRYRAPDGTLGRDNPTTWAGLVLRNSEVGHGAFSIVPRVFVQVCKNGLVVQKDAMREVHLGSKMDEGDIVWSQETQKRNLALIASQTKDAVQTFLSPEYLQKAIDNLTAVAEAPVRDASKTIANVSKNMGFTKTQGDAILAAFIDGADATAGGVMQAITATANTLSDGDAAFDLESKAVQAMELAAKR